MPLARRGVTLLALAVAVSLLHASSPARGEPEAVPVPGTERRSWVEDTRPNIVVVNLDDMRASDLTVMDTVTSRIAARGVTFRTSVVTTSNCCPSRATHLTGRYAHNTGVLHNAPPHGGYPALRTGLEAAGETLPVWLADAGYRTVFLGKYLNGYGRGRGGAGVPAGFTDWYGLYEGSVDGRRHNIYRQTRYAVRVRPRDGDRSLLDPDRARDVHRVRRGLGGGHLHVYEGRAVHQTEVFMDGAIAALEQLDDSQPLYLNVWLTAPHTGSDAPIVGGPRIEPHYRELTTRPGLPELRRLRARLAAGDGLGELRLERPASFNERYVGDKPPFLAAQPRLTGADVEDVEIRNALRLAALQSVDRRLAELLAAVDDAHARTGRASYVVFTSDNGFFLGEHRLPYQKNLPYGAATDVPLVIRGPRVAAGVEVAAPVANIDLAPTLLDMAGEAGGDGVGTAGALDADVAALDGRSLLPLLRRPDEADPVAKWADRAVLLEGYWGRTDRLRYAAVRTSHHLYVEHYAKRDGRTVEFVELYDLRRDPDYRTNLLHGPSDRRSERFAGQLADLLDELVSCEGRQCRGAVHRR